MRGYLAAGPSRRRVRSRPLALRPHLTMGLPFSGRRLWWRVSPPPPTLLTAWRSAIRPAST